MEVKHKKGLQRWATVREASEYYQVGRQRIHNLIKSGSLGRTLFINMGSRKLWLVEYPFKWVKKPIGRPRKLKRKEGKYIDS
jgi:hypothetical protein